MGSRVPLQGCQTAFCHGSGEQCCLSAVILTTRASSAPRKCKQVAAASAKWRDDGRQFLYRQVTALLVKCYTEPGGAAAALLQGGAQEAAPGNPLAAALAALAEGAPCINHLAFCCILYLF